MKPRHGRRFGRGLSVALLAAGLAVFCGCGKGERATIPFRGELTYAGAPLNAQTDYEFQLIFYLQDDPEKLPMHPGATVRVKQGAPENNGAFQASTYRPDDGLPEGKYKVTATLQAIKMQMGQLRTDGRDVLQNRYGDPQTTPLEVIVRKGMEQPWRAEVK